MILSKLINSLEKKHVIGNTETEINKITFDSRQVNPGDMFVAIRGVKTDGHKYIPQALSRGACAIVTEEDLNESFPGTTVIKVQNSRKALASLAACFFNYPAEKLKIIGVTGTNGKTTTTHMISDVLEEHGIKTGIIGTLYIKIRDKTIPARVTTPESLEIQEYLAEMVSAGIGAVAMEVSSHSLYFDRVYGIKFTGAIFTNLTQDHLDFHGDMKKYFNEKKKLFTRIISKDKGGFGVINNDDPKSREIADILSVPYISYGLFNNPDLSAKNISLDMHGTSFTAKRAGLSIPVHMKMAGKFNVYNALAAIGTGLFMGVPPSAITKGLERTKGVRGRFELVSEGQPFGIIVDYAHTPDGLKNVLESAKLLTKNRLIAVFGCGGDRDRTKRPVMGETAAILSDVIIVTSDNPRTEEPEAIIADIISGVKKIRKDYQIEPDRRNAIRLAIEQAKDGDVIVIAGKGHETYQIFKDKTIHFDDAEEARLALKQVRIN